jgi:hypothetical protein
MRGYSRQWFDESSGCRRDFRKWLAGRHVVLDLHRPRHRGEIHGLYRGIEEVGVLHHKRLVFVCLGLLLLLFFRDWLCIAIPPAM